VSGFWVEHNLLLLKQAAVTSSGRFSGNASRPGRIERCFTPVNRAGFAGGDFV
jgi:hypothetical protein